MNEASKLVVDSVLRANFKTAVLDGEAYTMNEPTIKILCRVVQYWCHIEMDEEPREIDVIASIPNNAAHLIKGLSVAITGDVWFWRIRAFLLSRRLTNSTCGELKVAVSEFMSLLNAGDFFECATSAMGVAKMVAKPR